MKPRMLEIAACEGGATAGYMRAGWEVTAVDLDGAALARNPATHTVRADGLDYLAAHGHEYDAIHMSWPCQRWAANGGNSASEKWPDLITPGRELANAIGRPWVMENVPKAPLRRDLILCGSMFGLTATDTDGTTLHLRRHRVLESNVPLYAPGPCVHPRGVQWAGVYGGARKDKDEARLVRKGGYVPPDAEVQSALLGGGAVDDRQGAPRVHPARLRRAHRAPADRAPGHDGGGDLMTTALPHRLSSSCTSARMTSAVTVVCSSAARSCARAHRSSGMRNFRGLVSAISGPSDACADLGTRTRALATVGEGPQGGRAFDVALGLGGVGVGAHLADDLRGACGDPVGLGAGDGAHGALRGLGAYPHCTHTSDGSATP